MEHRKNIAPRKVYVPSSWFIILTVMICIGGAGWLGWLLLDDGSSDSPSASPAPSSPAPSASPSTTPAPKETTASPQKTPTPTEPEVARDLQVSVLNNSGIAGAAKAFSAKVTQAGWPLLSIGNWTGSIPENTVYFPPGFDQQAALLGKDVGIDRFKPSVAPMHMDRLTVILSGPQ